jgi:hypothetical protein
MLLKVLFFVAVIVRDVHKGHALLRTGTQAEVARLVTDTHFEPSFLELKGILCRDVASLEAPIRRVTRARAPASPVLRDVGRVVPQQL